LTGISQSSGIPVKRYIWSSLFLLFDSLIFAAVPFVYPQARSLAFFTPTSDPAAAFFTDICFPAKLASHDDAFILVSLRQYAFRDSIF
jgi:hypothetical protein